MRTMDGQENPNTQDAAAPPLPSLPGASHLADCCLQKEHSHWKQTNAILHSDPFLHHVNNYTNWYNNSHQIVLHQSRPFIRPQSLTSLTKAYGNLMAPKLVKNLEAKELHIRQKAISWLVELLAIPDGRVQCFRSGVVIALSKRFIEEDMLMKHQLACAYKHVAEMQDGCVEMCRLGVIKKLLEMVSSSNEKLRKGALGALCEAMSNEKVRLELVHDESALPFIMGKIKEGGCAQFMVLGLKILRRCLAGGTDKIAMATLLKVDAISTSIDLLDYNDSDVREAALQLLCLLSMDKDGKIQAREKLGIAKILSILRDNKISLQASATAALMSITIDVDAKKDFIDNRGASPLIPLFESDDKIMSLNVLQLASNIAEHPVGRYELQRGVSQIQHKMNSSKSNIQKRFAKASLQQLRFKHRPFN